MCQVAGRSRRRGGVAPGVDVTATSPLSVRECTHRQSNRRAGDFVSHACQAARPTPSDTKLCAFFSQSNHQNLMEELLTSARRFNYCFTVVSTASSDFLICQRWLVNILKSFKMYWCILTVCIAHTVSIKKGTDS